MNFFEQTFPNKKSPEKLFINLGNVPEANGKLDLLDEINFEETLSLEVEIPCDPSIFGKLELIHMMTIKANNLKCFCLGVPDKKLFLVESYNTLNTEVAPVLDSLMDDVEKLMDESHLPEEVDIEYWNRFICECIEKELFEVDKNE